MIQNHEWPTLEMRGSAAARDIKRNFNSKGKKNYEKSGATHFSSILWRKKGRKRRKRIKRGN